MPYTSLILAAVVAAAVVLITGPFLIPKLHQLKFGQSIREEGPKSHQAKSGTPTMGGMMIILGLVVGALAAGQWSVELGLALFIVLGHFVIGFVDDYIKVVRKHNLGLKAKQKLLGQIIMAAMVAYFGNLPTDLWVPFVGNVELGSFFYVLLFFVLVGTTNAVNLTDGLDGLAAGTVSVASLCFMVVCLILGNYNLAIFCAATVGACLAFLKLLGFFPYNHKPAKIFMGDTGSLALGGAIASMGILTHTELLLVVIGFIFVMEAMSVIIQVISFKTTGKRVFLMSPIHHHFELKGWKETKVVHTFWCWGLLAGILGILLLTSGQ